LYEPFIEIKNEELRIKNVLVFRVSAVSFTAKQIRLLLS
jgi:hypothetical protein